MALSLYDTAYRSVRPLDPVDPGHVRIYLCGATVQGSPHVGHLRSGLAFDVLVRWLRRSGVEVTLVRNVTDIDDKILVKSAEAGKEWWAWAARFEREFTDAYEALGILPPTYEPRATGHITEQVELAQRLIDRGHAYATDAGNVYFDVASFPAYGDLTRQKPGSMEIDEDEREPDKRAPHDFALWKAAKPTEPATASWPSPWGRGRPGWHLECSAMSQKYLGDEFDLHGGGIDLRFPHHENEQAQSRAAGYGFARRWMHNAWVTVDGEKMSKSLGNSLVVSEVLKKVPAPVLRWALATVHYRSTVAFGDATLAEAQGTWDRITSFLDHALEVAEVGEVPAEEIAAWELPAAFVEALDDDLNVAGGVAVVHETLKAGNTALAERRHADARRAQGELRAMLDVLGLDPLAEPWRASGTGAGGGSQRTDAEHSALDVLVRAVLEERAQARAAKDWGRADALRDRLAEAGITVEDSVDGARWRVGGK